MCIRDRVWTALDLYFAGDAGAAYDLIETGQPDYSRGGPAAVFIALIEPYLALVAGRPAEALTEVDTLLATLTGAGFASQMGEALRLRGDALRQLDRRDEARAAYTQALEVATKQGALRSVEPARAALLQTTNYELRTTNEEHDQRLTTNDQRPTTTDPLTY